MKATSKELSLVIASFNRVRPLESLLNQLECQTLPQDLWEVIVAVDGSVDGTQEMLAKWASENHLPLRWFYQKNAGQAAARHNAILRSTSSKIVIIDDDLSICPDFLENHLIALQSGDGKTIVIGKVVPNTGWGKKPLYELVREYTNAVTHRAFEAGAMIPNGEAFVTQNVSFYRDFYLQVGGFDPEMRLGEDTELGVRFELNGARFIFCKEACAIHLSNIGSYNKWLFRQYEYGKYAWLAWKKSGEDLRLHPLQFFCTGNRLNRLLVLMFVRSSLLTNLMVFFLKIVGGTLGKFGLVPVAVASYRAIISLKQHEGIRDAYGSWTELRKAELAYKTGLQLSQI